MYHILFGKSNLTISLSVYDWYSESVCIVGIEDVLKRNIFCSKKMCTSGRIAPIFHLYLPYLQNSDLWYQISLPQHPHGKSHSDRCPVQYGTWFGIWPLIDVQFISSPLSVSRTHPTPLPSHLWPCMSCNRDGLTVEGEEHYRPHPTTGSRHRS